MRIAMVTQWYDPEGSSAALPGVISRAIMEQGHEVHVVTGFPNYPSGRVFPGYQVRPYAKEVLRGVTVHRSPLYASHDGRAIARAANYLSFATGAAAVAMSRLPQVDVALVHGTPATAAIPALALKAMRGVPFVLHVQDLWPQTVVDSGLLGRGRSLTEASLHRYCDLTYRAASAVAVIAPGMIRHISARGVPDGKLSVVPNWADEVAFRPVPKNHRLGAELGLDRRFTVMYAGAFGGYQNLDILVEAARRLRHRPDIGFALVGGGVEEARLRATTAASRLENVRFVPLQPVSRMADVLALGDVQVVSLVDRPLFRATVPSKLQATMAAARPILGALVGDAAEVVQHAGAGLVVPPGSTTDMVDAILRLTQASESELRAMGERGRQFYTARFSQAVSVERLTGLLREAAGGRERVLAS